MRPRSILLFERLFALLILLSLASGVYTFAVGLPSLPPGVPMWVPRMMPWMMAGGMIVSLAINLLLWLFIARYRSNTARWIFAFLLLLAIFGLFRQQSDQVAIPPHLWLFSTVGIVLQAICAWLLFRPDTRRWFRR